MDRRERFAREEEALRLAMAGQRAGLWTALPGIFQSFNTDKPDTITATIQPAIQGVLQQQDGAYIAVNLPLLVDVPVCFPHGGGCSLTFPIAIGDECLVIFSSRCIDAWWQSGGYQNLPMEPRMHDLSDGFAIPGPYSQKKKISNISTSAVQLRTDDAQTFIELNPTTHELNAVTSGDITVNAGGNLDAVVGEDATVQIDGGLSATVSGDATLQIDGDLNVTVSGDVTADITGALTSTVGTSVHITSPMINLVGIVNITGALNVSGLTSLNGGFGALPKIGGGASTIHSDITISGSTAMQAATMTSSNVGGKDNGPTHTHSNGNGGSPTGGII